ncbi:tyrosine-type recombinase/integrase [Mesorhizobium sp. M1307]|uniref:tyrosine-type recombinase/integrase n=1 Tax=Mesorhizobium sp. M1307 TaxID=2957079 RepID=UPI00333B8CB0
MKVGTKRPLKPRQIWAIRFFLDREQRLRDRALFDLAIDSKLRGCDLVKIKIGTLVIGPEIRSRAMVVQQKTGRPVQFELMGDARASLLVWLERWNDAAGPLMTMHFRAGSTAQRAAHLSTRQYARLVDEWVAAIGLRPQEYGTHSLRRTKASIIYKATGNLRAIQILLGSLATPRSRTRSVISVSTSRMPLNLPRQRRSDQQRLHFPIGAANALRPCRP